MEHSKCRVSMCQVHFVCVASQTLAHLPIEGFISVPKCVMSNTIVNNIKRADEALNRGPLLQKIKHSA